MIVYLLPLLIGYTGGKAVWGIRGGVVGAIVTMGVIVGTEIPMFLGAMIVGPLGGLAIKGFDKTFEEKIPVGFEMLTNNFSAGIIGGVLAIVAYLIFAPILNAVSNVLMSAVDAIVNARLLPLAQIFIEPGKVLFLNNAINHGVLSPLGIQQVQESGRSILFLLETNPGPGLGLLLAYSVFAKGVPRDTAPSAIVIHFFGGIHEIYFPYVLMNPILILAMIAGGISAVIIFVITGAGLVATPSPGSIFAYLAVTPRGAHFGVYLGMLVSIVTTFFVAAPFVKRSASALAGEQLATAQKSVSSMKAAGKVSMIAFACDAGMGTSAMGANKLRRMIKAAGITGVSVKHVPVDDVPQDAQIVITQENLVERVRKTASSSAQIVTVTNLVNAPEYQQIVDQLK